MKYEYCQDNLILKVLLQNAASEVLGFYSSNSDCFDKYEADKPAGFYTLKFIGDLLKAENDAFMHGNGARFFLYDTEVGNSIIGTVSFQNIRRGAFCSCQIGYKIDKQYQKFGYGTKMVSMAMDIIVNEYNMHRIEAYVMAENQASIALLNKVGFINEGVAHSFVKLRGEWIDHQRFVYINH